MHFSLSNLALRLGGLKRPVILNRVRRWEILPRRGGILTGESGERNYNVYCTHKVIYESLQGTGEIGVLWWDDRSMTITYGVHQAHAGDAGSHIKLILLVRYLPKLSGDAERRTKYGCTAPPPPNYNATRPRLRQTQLADGSIFSRNSARPRAFLRMLRLALSVCQLAQAAYCSQAARDSRTQSPYARPRLETSLVQTILSPRDVQNLRADEHALFQSPMVFLSVTDSADEYMKSERFIEETPARQSPSQREQTQAQVNNARYPVFCQNCPDYAIYASDAIKYGGLNQRVLEPIDGRGLLVTASSLKDG